MTDFAYWASLMFFPACVMLLAGFVFLLHQRDEARWAREAREQKNPGTPAE